MKKVDKYLAKIGNDSYLVFERFFRALPRNPDGSWAFGTRAFHDTDVDAFRHAYTSGVLTQEYGEVAANVLGRLNEIEGDLVRDQSTQEMNMDLWNNRQYQAAPSDNYSEIEFDKPVITVFESETGRNECFLDLAKEKVMSVDEFVVGIQNGLYPGYIVERVADLLVPKSKPDSKLENNLG